MARSFAPFACPAGSPRCLDSPNLGAPTADMPFYSSIPYEFTQIAFFAEGSFDMTERLTGTLGARYYNFNEDRVLTFGGVFSDPSAGPGSAAMTASCRACCSPITSATTSS